VSSTACFLDGLSRFFSYFRRQIYACPLTLGGHALPSRRPCRVLPWVLEAVVMQVIGDRCVALTRQDVSVYYPRVLATLRTFWPRLAASGVSGVGSSAGCVRMRRVSHTRRHSGESAPFSTAGDLFRVFCLCVVFSLVSMYSLPLCVTNFTRICLVRGFIVILVILVILLGSCF
jgi:hypothetical protein